LTPTDPGFASSDKILPSSDLSRSSSALPGYSILTEAFSDCKNFTGEIDESLFSTASDGVLIPIALSDLILTTLTPALLGVAPDLTNSAVTLIALGSGDFYLISSN
jgi:hypothetical protein